MGVDEAKTGLDTNLNDTFYSPDSGREKRDQLVLCQRRRYRRRRHRSSANPSIAGGSGLENQYVADGVNITDGAFGGIGVYSRVYGPLATGINLSFVKEVDVKTGGYEPQYGKSTGGLVQIVTKSGGNAYHGGVSGFFGPQQFEAGASESGQFRPAEHGWHHRHQGAWDVAGEFGGYVPGMKDHLFFFGSFNPSYNAYYNQFANMHGVVGLPVLGNTPVAQYSYDYSGKLTWKLNDKNTIESSVFGDPTREGNFAPNFTLATFSKTTFDKLSNGTRNWVARYNATLSPTWLFNASFSWGHNYLTDTPQSPGIYQVSDFTGRTLGNGLPNGPNGGQLSGQYIRQGLGYYENTTGDNYGLTFDTQKVVNKFGSHTFSIGYHYERNYYDGSTLRTGPGFTITPDSHGSSWQRYCDRGLDRQCCFPVAGVSELPILALRHSATTTGITFRLYTRTFPAMGLFRSPCCKLVVPLAIQMFNTRGRYHAAYANDSWELGKHITINAGYRWEQQFMLGSPYTLSGQNFHVHYTYTDNWSPRFGLAIDPLGDRKTKIYGNFARYSYAIPLDMAIRSLSNEQDAYNNYWTPASTGPYDGVHANLAVNPDGTLARSGLDDPLY